MYYLGSAYVAWSHLVHFGIIEGDDADFEPRPVLARLVCPPVPVEMFKMMLIKLWV